MVDQNTQNDPAFIKYVMIEFVGVLFALYFIMSATDPVLLQDMGFPVLVNGNINYFCAVLVFSIFALPLMRYVINKTKHQNAKINDQ